MACLCRQIDKNDNGLYFYSVHSGSELDLFWQAKGKNWGAEFKYTDAPRLTQSMKTVQEDLELSHLWVVYPGKMTYRITETITALSLMDEKTMAEAFG